MTISELLNISVDHLIQLSQTALEQNNVTWQSTLRSSNHIQSIATGLIGLCEFVLRTECAYHPPLLPVDSESSVLLVPGTARVMYAHLKLEKLSQFVLENSRDSKKISRLRKLFKSTSWCSKLSKVMHNLLLPPHLKSIGWLGFPDIQQVSCSVLAQSTHLLPTVDCHALRKLVQCAEHLLQDATLNSPLLPVQATLKSTSIPLPQLDR